MKLFYSLAMAWALSLVVNAATVSFSGITSTNAVKTNDLLLVDSALGGTNYATRTATIATLQSALSIPTVPTGLVSNSVAQSGLLAVDATKTNGVAATFGMVTNALGYLPATNSSLGNYVLKAGDTMTGNLTVPLLIGTNITGSINGVVNVKSPPYSAVGDGLTDDTASISNALKSARAVYFPTGTYLTSTMYPTNNSVIFGDGFGSKIVYNVPAGTSSLISCGANGGVGIHDLWLHSTSGTTNFNTGSPPVTTTAITHYVTNNSYVSRVKITSFAYGIEMAGPNNINARYGNALYTGNVITNTYVAFHGPPSNAAEYCTIEGNVMEQNYIAFFNETGANVLFVGNNCKDGTYGIWCYGATRGHSLYEGNIINHMLYPLRGDSSASAMFIGNDMLGNKTGSAIGLTSCTNFWLVGNSMELQSAFLNLSGGQTNVMLNNLSFGVSTLNGGQTTTNSYWRGNRSTGGPIFGGTSGTATIASGQTSTNITHNLSLTPLISDFVLTPQNNLGNATKFWISAVSSTTFTITVDADPGATTAIFSWRHVE